MTDSVRHGVDDEMGYRLHMTIEWHDRQAEYHMNLEHLLLERNSLLQKQRTILMHSFII